MYSSSFFHSSDSLMEPMFVIPDDVIKHIQEHPLAKQLYFTDIGLFQNISRHTRTRKQGCEQSILIYCYKGKGFYTKKGQKKYLLANQVLFIPENTPHQYGSSQDDPWSILWIHLKGEKLFSYIGEESNDICQFPITLLQREQLFPLFSELFDILTQGYHFNNLLYSYQIVAHILGVFFLSPIGQTPTVRDSKRSIQDIISYMANVLSEDLSLQDFAKYAQLSPSHFSSLFKTYTGYSPMNYFLRLKIQKACVYLTDDNLTISEISSLLGFHDPLYFSRFFHKIMNVSPSAYRKQKKG